MHMHSISRWSRTKGNSYPTVIPSHRLELLACNMLLTLQEDIFKKMLNLLHVVLWYFLFNLYLIMYRIPHQSKLNVDSNIVFDSKDCFDFQVKRLFIC